MEEVDITPNPRILRTLGEIPFRSWQCMAELIDNSLDAFSKLPADDPDVRRINITWSSEDVPLKERQWEIADSGPGMTPAQLQDCVRAGYGSKNPMDHLGMFGMGFNIATARLGDKTLIMSATADSKEFVGLEIDFEALGRSGKFAAPVRRFPKSFKGEHGTKVVVSQLKPQIIDDLRQSQALIRKTLEDVYTPILSSGSVEIRLKNQVLRARPHCVWDENRYVVRNNKRVFAIQKIDYNLGEALFDVTRNRYLSPTEIENMDLGAKLPADIVRRQKRIQGWIGIQRYSEPTDFGLDFIRNGRKILLRDKTLFNFNNSLTNRSSTEYPVELGSTTGGRIVGEICVNHLNPNYQKTDFDRLDQAWLEMVANLRGDGPILPNSRSAMGFVGENESVLGKLINAYRRADAGTKCLAAPNAEAKGWAEKFRAGDPEWQADQRWFEAAQQAERARADKSDRNKTPIDRGAAVSDSVDEYAPSGAPAGTSPASAAGKADLRATAPLAKSRQPVLSKEALIAASRKDVLLSGEFGYAAKTSTLNVTFWELLSGEIERNGAAVPCLMLKEGNECSFFYDPRHRLFVNYAITPKMLAAAYLTEKFKVRDQLGDDIGALFSQIIERHCDELRIDPLKIQEGARAFFDRFREASAKLLALRELETLECIHESTGEVEEIAAQLVMHPQKLLDAFQKKAPGSIRCLAVSPPRTLIRLFERFPEEYCDGRLFTVPYREIALTDAKSSDRLRSEVRDRLAGFMKDAAWALTGAQFGDVGGRRREELERCAHSVNLILSNLQL